jgi:ribosomal-protein-alanine N-acetyltransferase
MEIVLDACTVRSWRAADAESLTRYANNRRIWDNLRDLFPHPYTIRAARDYLQIVQTTPETSFAIDVMGEAVGGVGFVLKADVVRVSAEIGYWLGEPFWGKGIATAALAAVTQHAIATHGLTRIYALPFAHNLASCRVLEKAGYVLEGRLRRSAIKNGVVIDQMQYGFIAPGDPPPSESRG